MWILSENILNILTFIQMKQVSVPYPLQLSLDKDAHSCSYTGVLANPRSFILKICSDAIQEN